MGAEAYDRAAEDAGGIVLLEHVNLAVPDQRLATVFYVVGMGFTRDPYLMVGDDNMWINVGRQQFHLPTGDPQVLRGCIGVVVPDLGALESRLSSVRARLAGTRFAYAARDGALEVVCPWGNRLRCHAPGERFGAMTLGLAYVEFDVPRGAAAGIARFYREGFAARVALADDAATATVSAGGGQRLVFSERDGAQPRYDGHHIALYVTGFSALHRFLAQHDLVTEESNRHQYRFQDLFDLQTGEKLFEVEHEIRSLGHPLWARPLINRDPAQSQRAYRPGADAYRGA
jgi:hypothetical protein